MPNGSDPTRGSNRDRKRRRQWLLDTYGNGVSAPCAYCSTLVTLETLSVDRIVPGCQGGTYGRQNIRPACIPCNTRDGGRIARGV